MLYFSLFLVLLSATWLRTPRGIHSGCFFRHEREGGRHGFAVRKKVKHGDSQDRAKNGRAEDRQEKAGILNQPATCRVCYRRAETQKDRANSERLPALRFGYDFDKNVILQCH